jgi:tRNA threonylcarbamoyladenosine biosynthesis protein TsaE
MQLTITTSEDMEELGSKLADLLQLGDLVLLSGELGAGKTTLTRGLGEALGAEGTIQSPTFVLAREHRIAGGGKLVHVDAYRLSSAVELDDLDIDFAGSIVVVEWARDFFDGYAENYLSVEIDRTSDDEVREVILSAVGPRWEGVDLASLN